MGAQVGVRGRGAGALYERGTLESLLYGVAILACPVGMGAMMLMMRGQSKNTESASLQQVAQLRAEVEQLKAECAAQRAQETV